MSWKIPLFKIFSDGIDTEYVRNVIERGSNWANGSEINEFEKKIADYVGIKYALTFNSGTSALHALLIAYGMGSNDEIIVPSFTFIATANSPLFVGARPVFSEIEEKTCGLDPEDVKEKISHKTKAILPIHYGGCPCLIKELRDIADDHKIILIEDAAESLGAKIGCSQVGTFGDSAILSFCQNKIITTGEGGAVITNSKKIFEKLKLLRSHGRLENCDYFSSTESMDYVTLGYNMRLSSISAALGLSQLEKIDDIIKLRRSRAEYMSKKLENISKICVLSPPSDYFHVYQMFTIRTSANYRNKLMDHLANKGIMTKIYFPSVHLTDFYRTKLDCRIGQLPVTENISNQVLSLPIYPTLMETEIDYIVDCLIEFFEGKQ